MDDKARIEELKKYLKDMASRECWGEEDGAEEFVDANDYSGGNFDDAYQGGCSDGETQLARQILKKLGKILKK